MNFTDSRSQALFEALEISAQMCEHAAAGDWPKVTALEPRRSALIRGGLSSLQAPPLGVEFKALLDRLAALDVELLRYSKHERGTRQGHAVQQKRSRRGVNAYRAAGRASPGNTRR